ncbi:prepilin peptidase [Tissierellaceae bacterium HCP3S3_D8]
MKVLVFIYGLSIGSFLNVCIYRMPEGKSLIFPPSHCPKCNHILRWYDNIPVISYLILFGRCRYCKDKISLIYPVVEILNGIIYVALYSNYIYLIDFIYYATVSSILLIIGFIDLKEMIIPDTLTVMVFIISVIYKVLRYPSSHIMMEFLAGLKGLVLAGILFLTIVLISKNGMGEGDIILISVLGFILGIEFILIDIFFSFVLAAIISLFLLYLKIKTKKDPIPFAPFIIISFFIVLFYGSFILDWYIHMIK